MPRSANGAFLFIHSYAAIPGARHHLHIDDTPQAVHIRTTSQQSNKLPASAKAAPEKAMESTDF